MNDKIAYIHNGLRKGAGMPVSCSFVATEGADFSAREAGTRVNTGARSENADRSLATEAGAGSNQPAAGSFKAWLVRMIETSFAHPYV